MLSINEIILAYLIVRLQVTVSLPDARHRRKRSSDLEEYEEETNQVWNAHKAAPRGKPRKVKHFCKRRPMYVEFSDINYDTWIVAPNGYQVQTR